MIAHVQAKNYRCLENVSVDLGALTVLVGRNGAGKSTFVDVLQFIRDALRVGLDTAIDQRHGIAALRRWSPRGRPYDVEVSAVVKQEGFWGEYSFVIGSGQEGEFRVKRETGRVGKNSNNIQEEFETRDGKWVTLPVNSLTETPNNEIQRERLNRLRKRIELTALVLPSVSVLSPSRLYNLFRILTETRFYTIFPNTLREPQRPSNEHILGDHGENLASALRQMKKGSQWFPDLLSALDKVAGGVSDLRVKPVGGFLVTELRHESHAGKYPWFGLAHESDGTLRTLGLLTALYQSTRRSLIAIEEPELTIHPGALGVISDVLKEASTRSQVLITTQSPDLIARFDAKELRVVERANGVTKIGPIDETQREAINAQLFSLGDLLRIEGLRRAVSPDEELVHA